MTHYQKLATMIFRVIGMVFLVLAGISLAVALLFSAAGLFMRGGLEIAFPIFVIYTIPTSIVGGIFFKFSKKLAEKVCFDFNE